MSSATWRQSHPDHNRAARARDLADHWWHNKSLGDALGLLHDAAAAPGGLPASDVRGVLPTYRAEAADCAVRRALGRGHLIECRRHLPCGGVLSIYHAMGNRP